MSDKKRKIVDAVKVFVGLFMMSIGFWMSYVFIWFAVGLPLTDWTSWICLALGLLSHRVYMWWLGRADNE